MRRTRHGDALLFWTVFWLLLSGMVLLNRCSGGARPDAAQFPHSKAWDDEPERAKR